MKAVFIFSPPWAPWAPSYALALLKSSAETRGHEFIGFDLNIDFYNAVSKSERDLWSDDSAPAWVDERLDIFLDKYSGFIDAYVEEIIAMDAKLCAFSVTSASSSFAKVLAGKIKERSTSIYILFGGPDCFKAEQGLDMLNTPQVDAICTGEADHFWPDFLDAFEKNGFKPSELKGLCYRGSGGNVVDCGDLDIVRDLDALPFADYYDTDFSKYSLKNRACLMMSRGCINRCTYCSEGRNFLIFRYRSAQNLFDETKKLIEYIKKNSVILKPHINYSDSLINGRPKILEEFCDLVISEKLKFTWGGMALLRKEMTKELLTKMQKAGCIELMWGLESGSQNVLRMMGKNIFTTELAEKIIKNTHDAGIKQYTNIIVGFPGETEDMFQETFEFLKANMKYFESVGLPVMEIKRNSHVYSNYQAYKIREPVTMHWSTVSSDNTLEIRMQRRDRLKKLLDDQLFDQGRYEKFDNSFRSMSVRKTLKSAFSRLKSRIHKMM